MRRHQPKVRRHQPRLSHFAAGVIAVLVIATACYFVFGGAVPFSGTPFQLRAVFTSETELHIPSPVRVAGVDVGEVTSVTRVAGISPAAVVTMSINPDGLPIHGDATAKIRPRIFLEGNFYVDLRPGTPAAPALHSGATLSVTQTSGPVQLDRVLSSLNSAARTDLETLLRGLGGALDGHLTAARDAGQDPLVRGLTGGQALNSSLRYSADAFKASAMVNQALLGVQPHDLSGVVAGNASVFRALAASGNQLAGFVTTFNATMAAFAARQQQLGQTIAALPPFLQRTQSSDTALDASFGPTKAFARALAPGIGQLGPAIDAGLPWLAQASALMSPQELGGLVRYLTPAIQNTGATIATTRTLISQADLLSRCFDHNIIPTGNQVIADAPIGTGQPVYRELFQSAVGIAAAAQNFDGNGRYIRANAGGGGQRIQTPPLPGGGPAYGNSVVPALGTRPAFAGSPPPVRRDVACFKNAVPALNRVSTGPGS
jgi:phospholipid/cholesterol/gamma-HCH transport system substrate-binding protein